MNEGILSLIESKEEELKRLESEISELKSNLNVPEPYIDKTVKESGYELLFRQMEDAYIIVDKEFRYVDSNISAKEMFPKLETFEYGQRISEKLYKLFIDGANDCWLGTKYYEKKVTPIMLDGEVIGYGMLLDDDTDLQTKIFEKTQHIQVVQDSIIAGMASVVESRDNSTGGHIMRTRKVVKIFARKLIDYVDELEISLKFLNNVIKAAPMHDIGKIAVDDVILRKPGRFTDEEYEKMKKHSGAGAEMLVKILSEVEDKDFVEIAINIARNHHERWDGKGYPNGIKGEEIPLEARIMALADVFDALVSKRCYKEAYNYDRAFSIIEDGMGTQFDPFLSPIFISCRDELEQLYNEIE